MSVGEIASLVIAFLAGWMASLAYREWRKYLKTTKQVAIPLMVGRGDEGQLVMDVELSDEEAALVISATKLFVAEMEKKYGVLYLPTETELAQADIAQEENEAFDEALASTYK